MIHKEYYYTYYSYEEWGRGYIGSRGCDCLPEEDVKYFGSYTDKTFHPTQKIILEIYKTREEAFAAEITLHEFYDVANNPHFANRAKQTSTKFHYIPSFEEASKSGKINGKLGGKKTKELGVGIFSQTKDQIIENGRKGALKAKELGVGLYGRTKEKCIESGKRSQQHQKELGIGLYGRTEEQRKEDCMKGVLKAKELGIGLFALTQEFRSEHGKKMHKLGLGIHSLTSEEKAEYASISGKEVSARKYMCTETGFVANAGNLAIYQRARGIDTSNRIRLS